MYTFRNLYMYMCIMLIFSVVIWAGLVKSDKEIWKTLLESPSKSESNSIQIIPTIFGERHAPSQRGEVTGVTAGNMDLHHVFQALCKGLVENLTKMMSPSFLKQKGIHKLLGTGSVIHKNPIIQREVMTQYGGLNIELGGQSDSAFGAALFCEASDKRWWGKLKRFNSGCFMSSPYDSFQWKMIR